MSESSSQELSIASSTFTGEEVAIEIHSPETNPNRSVSISNENSLNPQLEVTLGRLESNFSRMDATTVHMSNTMDRFTSSMDKLASAVDSLAVSVEKNTQLFAEVHLKLAERNTMIVEFMERRERAADERLARIEEHQKCLNAILKQLQVQKDEKENTVKVTVQPTTETSDQAQVIADLQRRLDALERKGESNSSDAQ